MHHLTELPTGSVTDATASVYTGGILWRLSCAVCLIFLSIVCVASSLTLEDEGFEGFWALGMAEVVVGTFVWAVVVSEPTLETDKGCLGKGDLCLSNIMFYASLFALIAFANVAFMFGVFWWNDDHAEWELRREVVGPRDLIRWSWQGYRNPL